MHKLITAAVFLAALLLFSCKKDSFNSSPDAPLNITTDTVRFDTVFTSTGSVTQSFKIINPNKEKILLNSIKLEGGDQSFFHINIDGVQTSELTGIELNGNDSLYVFVSVTIDPNTSALPFILRDSISITYNSNRRYVQLEAYGQNAHFLRDEIINGSETWANDLPYVILGSLLVDTNVTLNISPGVRVYVHADAPVFVDGTLNINGTAAQPVVFRGDRLDEYYRDIPGGWPGIYLRNSSLNNKATFAIFKNAYQAIVVEGPSNNSEPKLVMQQCTIDNAFDAGLYAIYSEVNADNTLISNCTNNIRIEGGGPYNFTHNTIASYTTNYMYHTRPAVTITDAVVSNGTTIFNHVNVTFRNCIIWGENNSLDSEIETVKAGTGVFNVLVENTLYKADTDPNHTTFNAVIRNEDPLFDSIDVYNSYYNYRINNPVAPGIDKGTITPLTTDLDGNNRSVGLPDLGSYEKQ